MNHIKKIKIFVLTLFLVFPLTSHGQEDDAAASSATGSAAAPAKGAPKTAESNSKLRVLHIAIHKHGFSIADIKKVILEGGLEKLKNHYSDNGADNFAKHGDLLIKGHSLDDAIIYGDFLRDPSNEGKSKDEALISAKLLHLEANKDSDVVSPSLLISGAELLALSRYADNYTPTTQFTSALALAATLLTDKTIISESELTNVLSVDSLTGGYNLAFARLLSAYGAFGSDGENLASKVLGLDYSEYSSESTLQSLAKNSTNDYLSFLSTLTGERTFKDENIGSSVLDVPLKNVFLAGASTITLGKTGSTTSEVDVSSTLSKASSPSQKKVLVLGAAKDLKSAGNIKFTNSNDVEDHALVLGAADDVFIDGTNIEYTGSNLGIGSGDTGKNSMFLANTEITTGGNLAVGSLGTINVSKAIFTVGNANSSTSDPDNVYLYANELLDINDLSFSGRIDDIYMESRTIHLKNTVFPSTADVMLRSKDGSLHFQTKLSDFKSGGVNFFKVKHMGISDSDLTQDHFQGNIGHINSNKALPNGTPFIKIRAQ